MKKTFLLFTFILFSGFFSYAQQADDSAGQLAQMQLDAYNEGNLEAFLRVYSENVKVYAFPNTLKYEGRDTMGKRYASMFENLPDLHCNLLNRIVIGNTVIDHEEVTFQKGQPKIYAVAIYKIENDKIAEVTFIYPPKKEES